MKQLLKVWLVMGWSLNLFASEDNPQFLALGVLNTQTSRDLVTIIRNERTSPQTKAKTFEIIANGLTFSDQQKANFESNLEALSNLFFFTSPSKTVIRSSFFFLCFDLNTIIRNLGVTHDFLPATQNVGLSAGQIVAAMALIRLIVGRFFASESEQDKTTREYLKNIDVEKIIKAYAP
jgi:hypothetical protein